MESDDIMEEQVADSYNYLKKVVSQWRRQINKVSAQDSESSVSDAQIIKRIKWTTVKYTDLPHWLQLNAYLHQGHRPPLPSYMACLMSWYRLHTETVNIWSHLLFSFAFSLIFIRNWFFSDYELREKLAFSPYVMGCAACFALSAAYHTVNCHSEIVSLVAVACDYTGIISCMLGFAYTATVYLWWCRWHWLIFYCVFYTGIAGYFYYLTLITFAVDSYTQKKRAVLAIAGGSASFLPWLHEISTDGITFVIEHYPLKSFAIVTLVCFVSAAIYATRMPECIWPGKFDIWFHSHQLFHVIIATTAMVGYFGLTYFAELRYSVANRTYCNVNRD